MNRLIQVKDNIIIVDTEAEITYNDYTYHKIVEMIEQCNDSNYNEIVDSAIRDKVIATLNPIDNIPLILNTEEKNREMKQQESKLQCACLMWFRLQYPQYRMNLFAIPNGSSRHPLEGARLKREGVVAGVADMFLAYYSNNWYGTYHGLFIEFKAGKNKQTDEQIAFQKAVDYEGYLYQVVRSFDEFRKLVEQYLNLKTKVHEFTDAERAAAMQELD